MKRAKDGFSRGFREAVLKAEMVEEMAIVDGWASLDVCLEKSPPAIDIFLRHAEAAMRVVRRRAKSGCFLKEPISKG